MKTFTIPLLTVETNFQKRAELVFSQFLTQYFKENGMVQGEPLGENVGIFVTIMTRKEIEDLKKLPHAEQEKILKNSVPGAKHE